LRDDVATKTPTIVVALAVDDPALAARLTALLRGVAGLRLARAGERADVTLSAPPPEREHAELEHLLTPREVEVLTLLAEGASNKTIARRLGISVHTAKFHVGQLIDKLDATGRTDAVAHAARLGVIHL
jgi:DNA-binding CsgD family transcriptional regulator